MQYLMKFRFQLHRKILHNNLIGLKHCMEKFKYKTQTLQKKVRNVWSCETYKPS